MQRYKTFQSTGIAPDGRLYAGDLNAIQDAAAGLTDFTQTISLGTLRIGEAGLTLSRIGTGESQLQGKLKVTDLLTGNAGVVFGAFTTAQRDAIAAGKAPTGIIIFNITENEHQFNAGTDSARFWLPLGTDAETIQAVVTPPGVIMYTAAAAAPSGWLICDGSAISRTTFSALFNQIGTQYGIGNGSTTFNIPDMQGRMVVSKGTHADVNALNATEGESVGNRRPKHKHTVGGSGASDFAGASAGTATVPRQPGTITVGPQTNSPTDAPAYIVLNGIIKT